MHGELAHGDVHVLGGSRPSGTTPLRRGRPGGSAELRLRAERVLQQGWFLRHQQRLLRTRVSVGQSGPCSVSGGGIGVPVESVVTAAFFNGIKSQAGNGCAGKDFYTRQSFLDGARANPNFAKGRSYDDSKREIAAFFAHVTHETGHFCYIEEINGASQDYCDERVTEWPCLAGKAYYGRGPLQLTWNYNYGPAGQSVGFDGLRNPQKVAQDPVVAFKSALWFWMNNVHPVMPQGFGATTRAVSGLAECDGGNSAAMNARVSYYRDYCKKFGVDPGNYLTC